MTMQNLTLAEMERLAYIEGRTEEAALLAALMDEPEGRAAEINRLEDEIDSLNSEMMGLEGEIDDLKDRLEECDCGEGKATP